MQKMRRHPLEFNGLPILVIGDVMLDYYISGAAARVSPEAPVPVVNKKHAWSVPGGAANVARCLSRLGCAPRLVGLTGEDVIGEILRQQTAAEGIMLGLVKSGRRQTTCKTRILAAGQQLLRVDEESVLRPDLQEITSLRVHVQDMLADLKALVLSDYGKGALLPDKGGENLCTLALAEAKAAQIPVIVDPKGIDWERYKGAACVTPNTGEFLRICEALGFYGGGEEPGSLERQKLAEMICVKFDLGRLLLTRGARGMTLYEPGWPPFNIRALAREVSDVSGAGDTVIAVLAACIAAGSDWREAAKIANVAAGVAVGKLGTAPVSIVELNRALAKPGENPKLFELPELLEKISRWRRENQKIVFTNGCFDLLHPGHVSLLRQAASFGDKLIVGLNSDESVRRLKGASRPIQTESSRAMLLSALHAVDAVVIFGEDTPEELVHAIRPDVLVKGSDYEIQNVAGARFVQSYGGQVKLVDLVEGCSTTSLAARIKAGENGKYSRS